MPLVEDLDLAVADYPLLRRGNFREMVWYCEITAEMGTIDQILSWCRGQAGEDWCWHLLEYGYREVRYRFFFVREKDYLLFILNWA